MATNRQIEASTAATDGARADKKISYKWKFIEDYELPPRTYAKPELTHLADVWKEQRQALANSEGLQKFLEQLRREWAIETGLLERIYTLDRGVTQILIERGIDAAFIPDQAGAQDPKRVAAIIRDHEEAIEGLFSFVRRDRVLSTSYVKDLHAQLTRNQETTEAVDSLGRLTSVPLLRGAYKTLPNNPSRADGSIHEYCPPEHVAAEMDRMIELFSTHAETAPEVEAAWLHHRFTQIHPFQDGNGRAARCLATLVFLKAGWFPLVIRDTKEERLRYLDALEAADHGDLEPLVAVFAAAQKRALVQALGISGQVLRLTKAEQIVNATRELLLKREQTRRAEWNKAKTTARRLQEIATLRFREVAQNLHGQTSGFFKFSSFRADEDPEGGARGHYFRWQIIETAKQLGYFVNTAEYRAWSRLMMRTDSQAELLVSFHATGHQFRGILAASACFFRREETEASDREIADVTPLSTEIFQINYQENPGDAETRFRDWLEQVLVKGLEIWRAGL